MSERAPLPECVEAPERGSVLVLAPHADDEIIGCGGTIALHCAQGDRVRVLVCFDGAAGDPEGRAGKEALARDRAVDASAAKAGANELAARRDAFDLAARRRSEAIAAAEHLGAVEHEFWGHPEGHDPSSRELEAGAERLADLLRRFEPHTLYVPWVGEHHLDHHVVARAAAHALDLADFRGRAWGYEVWTPLVATRVVDITSVWQKKHRALCEHRSQLFYTDLVHTSLGLNAQRSIYLSPSDTRTARYGEAFDRFARRSESQHEDRPRHRSLSA